jgi:hypothetical protein
VTRRLIPHRELREVLYVTRIAWDVCWDYGGFGKHGHGPFETERQAKACLRAVGHPGKVVRVTVMQRTPKKGDA